MKQKDLARHLSISPGRVSQILNEGNINFSLEKLIEIVLKVDKYPNFIFVDKSSFREIKSQKIQVKSVMRKSRTEKQPNRTLIHK